MGLGSMRSKSTTYDKETWLQELGVDDFPTTGLDGIPLSILAPLRSP